MDDTAQLRADFDRLKQLALRRSWTPPGRAPCYLRLISMDSPDDVPFEPLPELVAELQRATECPLRLSFGGYGCFDLGFEGIPNGHGIPSRFTDAVEAAVTKDAKVGAALNQMRAHSVRATTPEAALTLRAYNDFDMAIATNRQRLKSAFVGKDIRGLFGADRAAETTYGLAGVSISDSSKGQAKEALLKRVWRRGLEGLGLRKKHEIVVRKLDLFGASDFGAALKPHIGKGAVMVVHGYANKFDDALDASVLGIHRTRLNDLDLLPVLFSWPAEGSSLKYLEDSKVAENSEFQLRDVLELLGDASGATKPSVMAHSHGNKLLVRALAATKDGRALKSHWLRNLVLVEPDVDEEFLEQRAGLLAQAADRIVLYHSKNDRALKVASFLFDSVRAGQKGIPAGDLDRVTAERLEIVDASNVAAGWTRHAPHVDSPEVISDLYYLFQGQPPKDRHGLTHVSTARWALDSATER